MGYTHINVSAPNGLRSGPKGSEVQNSDATGNLFQTGTQVTATAAELNLLHGLTLTTAQLNKLFSRYTVTALDGSTAPKKVCATNGVSAITCASGISDMSLAAPTAGDVATIRIDSLDSGSVVVKTPTGVTFNGTNNTAVFDAANESLVLAYASATAWQVVLNVGGVALSTT